MQIVTEGAENLVNRVDDAASYFIHGLVDPVLDSVRAKLGFGHPIDVPSAPQGGMPAVTTPANTPGYTPGNSTGRPLSYVSHKK